MRAALISIAGQPRTSEGTAPITLAGKTLAQRQLEFALAAGCERVIALGDGASAEAIALRHTAEDAQAGFQAIGDSRGLLGAVRATDELLVVAPGLLPEASEALDILRDSRAVLVLPAAAAVTAGFERIDLERAWAGVAVVPGALVERLSELPADIEPASALMRTALQARILERRLPEALLADGSWSMPGHGVEPADRDSVWLKRHSRPMRAVPGRAGHLLLALASKLLANRKAVPLLAGAAMILLAGAVVATWFGLAVLGFALIALGVLLGGSSLEVARLRATPFGPRSLRLAGILPALVDGTLVACAALAIDGGWHHRLFPPLVLLAALHLPAPPGLPAVARNRALLAIVLALAAGFEVTEAAVMLVALALLALNAAQTAARRG